MKIAFLSNKLTLRGTEVNLYDYADCNEHILGNSSIIITRPYDVVMSVSSRDVHPQAYKKFQDRFNVEFYEQYADIIDIVKRNQIDVLFIEKAGSPGDGLVFDCCKTIIHCVFTTKHPHGSLYTAISDSLNKIENTNIPVLPYMVRVHHTKENFRSEYNIPKDAIVFGSYSGADEYTIDYVKQAVINIASNSEFKYIYFIYLNIDPFGPECQRIKFFPGTADMEYKKRFINTCDAMLYGRAGGETFGLAVGEFSISGKPVIAKPGEKGCAHEDILGDAMIKCSKYEEVYDVLTNWDKYKKDVSNNGYYNYTEEKVMENFQRHLNTL
jgi:glycosyltransferase involved in cell wall biosynthesis